MHFSVLKAASLVAVLPLVTATGPTVSQCLRDCVDEAVETTDCVSPFDQPCICESQEFFTSVRTCINANCTEEEVTDARNISQELCAAQGLSVPPTVSPLAAPSTTATDSDLAASTTADADGTDHDGDDDDEDADDLGEVVDDTDASGVVFDGDSHGADEAEFVDSTDADVDGGADDFVVEAEIVDVDADADVNGDDHDANDTIAVPVEAADADAGNIQPAPADNATNFVEFIGAASSAYQIPAIVGGMTALIGLAAL